MSEIACRHEARDRLRAAGIGVTCQRLEIARVLFARWRHLTADKVLNAVNVGNAIASKATVYNILRLFVEKGLLREVIVDSGGILYESKFAPRNRIFDVQSCELADVPPSYIRVSDLLRIPTDRIIDRIDFVLRVRPVPS